VRTGTRGRGARESLAGPLLRAPPLPCASRAKHNDATPRRSDCSRNDERRSAADGVGERARDQRGERTPTLPKTPLPRGPGPRSPGLRRAWRFRPDGSIAAKTPISARPRAICAGRWQAGEMLAVPMQKNNPHHACRLQWSASQPRRDREGAEAIKPRARAAGDPASPAELGHPSQAHGGKK